MPLVGAVFALLISLICSTRVMFVGLLLALLAFFRLELVALVKFLVQLRLSLEFLAQMAGSVGRLLRRRWSRLFRPPAVAELFFCSEALAESEVSVC